jgi:ATP-dependent DNA ligase
LAGWIPPPALLIAVMDVGAIFAEMAEECLYSRQHDEEVQLYAFDILALDREDLRGLPLSMRKN